LKTGRCHDTEMSIGSTGEDHSEFLSLPTEMESSLFCDEKFLPMGSCCLIVEGLWKIPLYQSNRYKTTLYVGPTSVPQFVLA